MGNGNFWQLFLGKEPYSKKSDFVKAWLLWWAITILVLFILSLTTTLNLRSIGIGLSFGFISYIIMHVIAKEYDKVSPILWVIGILSIINLIV